MRTEQYAKTTLPELVIAWLLIIFCVCLFYGALLGDDPAGSGASAVEHHAVNH